MPTIVYRLSIHIVSYGLTRCAILFYFLHVVFLCETSKNLTNLILVGA